MIDLSIVKNAIIVGDLLKAPKSTIVKFTPERDVSLFINNAYIDYTLDGINWYKYIKNILLYVKKDSTIYIRNNTELYDIEIEILDGLLTTAKSYNGNVNSYDVTLTEDLLVNDYEIGNYLIVQIDTTKFIIYNIILNGVVLDKDIYNIEVKSNSEYSITFNIDLYKNDKLSIYYTTI